MMAVGTGRTCADAKGRAVLQQVLLRNFKRFDEQGITVDLGKITVLIGANGTGKSSVLQALSVLKQSLGSGSIALNGTLLSLGSHREIVHLQDSTRSVQVGVSVSYEGFEYSKHISPYLPPSGTYVYEATVGPSSHSHSGAIRSDRRPHLQGSWSPDGSSLSIEHLRVEDIATIHLRAEANVGCPIRVDGLTIHNPVEVANVRGSMENLLSTVVAGLASFYFIPAIRGFDRPTYEMLHTDLTNDLTAAGGPDDQARAVANLVAEQPELAEQVADRLNNILDNEGNLRTSVVQGRLASEMAWGGRSVKLINEAFGLNQLVAPLLWLSRVGSKAVVAIEEPEIHLHPRAQAALCGLFVDVATREKKQMILTTHSEHILMALLTAVADGRLAPNDLAVYEFRRDGGAARAERLEVNEYGQVEGGLRGFLEVDLDEIGDLIRARLR